MLEAVFSDILTDFGCSTLVKEMTKFILFSKQQIPFNYDRMNLAVKCRQVDTTSKLSKFDPSQRLFKSAEQAVISLEELFQQLDNDFNKSDCSTLKEIVLLLGGSLITPKQIYRIFLPPLEKGHQPRFHSDRSNMAELLRLIVSSDKLHQMLSNPLEPTNLFLLIRKTANAEPNNWLLPKPMYKLPPGGQQFSFKLDSKSQGNNCCCKGLYVYSDNSFDNSLPTQSLEDNKTIETPCVWYQAPVVLKGFKDIYAQGVSVSKSWFPFHKVENGD